MWKNIKTTFVRYSEEYRSTDLRFLKRNVIFEWIKLNI